MVIELVKGAVELISCRWPVLSMCMIIRSEKWPCFEDHEQRTIFVRLLSFTVECSLLSVLKFPQHMETAELGFFLVSFKFIQSAFSVISPVSLVFWSFSYPSSSDSLGNTLLKMWSSNCFKLNYIWICISQFKFVTELKRNFSYDAKQFQNFW